MVAVREDDPGAMKSVLPLIALTGTVLQSAALMAAPEFAPKVIVVTTYEIGADTGDKPGEFQLWYEREHLTNRVDVPGVDHALTHNGAGLWGMVSGTTVRSALQIQSLALDPRFDFSKTYWLVNGIAGVDPGDASVASAAWAKWVIDGDIAYEVDSREGDPAWPYAVIPVGSKKPNEKPKNAGWEPSPMAWELNGALAEWAFALTRDTVIPENDAMKPLRASFAGQPNAMKPPFVLIGDSLGSCRYWHGLAMTRWANDWSKLHTGGKANYVMTNMEDQGIANALSRLSAQKRVDWNRVMFLRTASNYCTPPTAAGVTESMLSEYEGLEPALESAYRVGSKVVHALLADWSRYAGEPPKP
jgi:purine nucleoside permease